MKSLDKIYEYVEKSTIILILNDNSRSLLDSLFNSIYKKYPHKKTKFESRKGIMRKVYKIKDKLIKVDFDITKIQFSSSNSPSKLDVDFVTLKAMLTENNSKILLKSDKTLHKTEYHIPGYKSADLVILIDKENIKIVKNVHNAEFGSQYIWLGKIKEENIYPLDQLLRSTKLKKIQDKLKFYAK